MGGQTAQLLQEGAEAIAAAANGFAEMNSKRNKKGEIEERIEPGVEWRTKAAKAWISTNGPLVEQAVIADLVGQ